MNFDLQASCAQGARLGMEPIGFAPAIATTWPTPPRGVEAAAGPLELSGVRGQPNSGNPMFRVAPVWYQYRSCPGKFPV